MRRSNREITDISVIEDIIQRADVCRIAMANDNVPYIVAMNFGYTGLPDKTLYFHCASEGRKLDMIKKNSYVCFFIDTDHQLIPGQKGCDWGMKYSSVTGYGTISILTDKKSKENGLNCIMSHYNGEGEYNYDESVVERTTILRLDITEITGKKC